MGRRRVEKFHIQPPSYGAPPSADQREIHRNCIIGSHVTCIFNVVVAFRYVGEVVSFSDFFADFFVTRVRAQPTTRLGAFIIWQRGSACQRGEDHNESLCSDLSPVYLKLRMWCLYRRTVRRTCLAECPFFVDVSVIRVSDDVSVGQLSQSRRRAVHRTVRRKVGWTVTPRELVT
jgi:hypothetical protein